MTELPETVTAGEIVFVRADSPADFAHWTAHDPHRPVSLIIEPAGVPADDVLAIASDIVTQFDEVTESALQYVRDRLREPEFALSAGDLAALTTDATLFAEPEAVIWSDGTWMLRFTDCGLEAASEYGVGVNFVGAVPQSVDLFDDAEALDDH